MAAMDADGERFDAKTTVLIESVRHHIDEEKPTGSRRCVQGWGVRRFRRSAPRWLSWRKTAPRKPGQPSALKWAIDAVIR